MFLHAPAEAGTGAESRRHSAAGSKQETLFVSIEFLD
jgi:hypothetical protein